MRVRHSVTGEQGGFDPLRRPYRYTVRLWCAATYEASVARDRHLR